MSAILKNGQLKQQLGKRDDSTGEHLQAGSVCRTGGSPSDKPVCNDMHDEAGKGRRQAPGPDGRHGSELKYPGKRKCPDCGTYITATPRMYTSHVCAQMGARRVRYDELTLEDYRTKVGYGLYLMGLMDVDRLEEFLNSNEREPVELYEARHMQAARR